MTTSTAPVMIDGIKCFSPAVANLYEDYPDCGFDLTAQVVEKSFWVRSRNRIFKSLVLANLAPKAVTRLFEVGCGTGDFLRTLSDLPTLAITGSEVYAKGLVYAQASVPGVQFVQLDIEHNRIDAEYDIVAAFDVIEHIEDDVSAIANMRGMLSRGGALIVSVPQYRFMWARLDDLVKHKRRYSRKELTDKLYKAGFEVTFCTSFVFLLFPFMLASRLFDRGHSTSVSDHAALQKRVSLPIPLNSIFDLVMRVDEGLIRLGLSLPFGGTLIAVARKTYAVDPHSLEVH